MRFGFSKSFPFTITGWRDVFAMGLRVGSYSDSDVAERCKMNGLGMLLAPRTEVADRTGESDISLVSEVTLMSRSRDPVALAWL
jgi:hypothetical protein